MAFLTSRPAQRQMLVVPTLLLALAALVVVLLSRPARHSLHDEASAGPIEVARTNLVLENGRLRQPGSASFFSGLMLEHYPDGTLRSRSAITNGFLHGLSEGWHTNAQLQVSEHFKHGISHGLRTKWYPDGAKQSEASIADGQLHGLFRKWHENGTLAEQVQFVGGQPDGDSFAYFPSGCLKARVLMKAGKLIEQKFWKDGENKG